MKLDLILNNDTNAISQNRHFYRACEDSIKKHFKIFYIKYDIKHKFFYLFHKPTDDNYWKLITLKKL